MANQISTDEAHCQYQEVFQYASLACAFAFAIDIFGKPGSLLLQSINFVFQSVQFVVWLFNNDGAGGQLLVLAILGHGVERMPIASHHRWLPVGPRQVRSPHTARIDVYLNVLCNWSFQVLKSTGIRLRLSAQHGILDQELIFLGQNFGILRINRPHCQNVNPNSFPWAYYTFTGISLESIHIRTFDLAQMCMYLEDSIAISCRIFQHHLTFQSLVRFGEWVEHDFSA